MAGDEASDDLDPWPGVRFAWQESDQWVPLLTRWLLPYLKSGAIAKLARRPRAKLYLDDPAWIDRIKKVALEPIDAIVNFLADDLMAAKLIAYHATRLSDAGVIHREGLKRNAPEVLADEARRIVADEESLAWMRPDIEDKIAGFESRDRDLAQLYVVADDREFLETSGHYLLYGSEWIQVLLGWSAHDALLRRGAPTVIKLELPLGVIHSDSRERFAEVMLREWSRQQAMGPDKTPSIDFTFHLRRDVPAEWIVGHHHPDRIRDPFHRRIRTNSFTTCPHCAVRGA